MTESYESHVGVIFRLRLPYLASGSLETFLYLDIYDRVIYNIDYFLYKIISKFYIIIFNSNTLYNFYLKTYIFF